MAATVNVRDSAAVGARKWLDRRLEHWIDLLSTLVGTDSHWANPAGVRSVGEILGDRLRSLGFQIERVPQPVLPEERRWLAELLAPGRRYEDLAETWIARRAGPGERVLMLGDLDTALLSHGGGLVVDGDRATGVGVADMKGGLVAMIAALEALAELGLPAPPLTIVLSGDEQAGSLGSSQVIAREADGTPWTLCLECGRDGGNLMAARGHIGFGLVEAVGREAHAGSAHAVGISAVEELARVIPAINALSEPGRGILVTVTMVDGGRRRSLIPGSARAVVDLRAADKSRWADLSAGLNSVVAVSPSLTLRFAAHRPEVSWDSGTDELLAVLREVGATIGVTPTAARSMAAGSSAFAAQAGSTVLDGLGPPGGDLMTDTEHVSVSGLVERSALLAGVLERKSEEPR